MWRQRGGRCRPYGDERLRSGSFRSTASRSCIIDDPAMIEREPLLPPIRHERDLGRVVASLDLVTRDRHPVGDAHHMTARIATWIGIDADQRHGDRDETGFLRELARRGVFGHLAVIDESTWQR